MPQQGMWVSRNTVRIICAFLILLTLSACVVTNPVEFDDYVPGGMRPNPTFLGAFMGGMLPGLGPILNGEYLEGVIYLGAFVGGVAAMSAPGAPPWVGSAGLAVTIGTTMWSWSDSVGTWVSRLGHYMEYDQQFGRVSDQVVMTSGPFQTIYPVLSHSYAQRPIAELTITNSSPWPLHSVTVAVEITDVMDSSHTIASFDLIEPGDVVEVPVTLILSTSILDRAEPAELQARITATYELFDRRIESVEVATVTLAGAGTLDLSEPSRLAALISPNDPAVRQFARGIIQSTDDERIQALSANLQSAAALHAGLFVSGFFAVADGAYRSDLSDSQVAFPRTTLADGGGSALDLALLYSAMLESIGVPARISLADDGVLVLIGAGVPASQVSAVDPRPGLLIALGDEAWIPVFFGPAERDVSFFDSWERGALSYRPDDPSVAIREAWLTYSPAPSPASVEQVRTVDVEQLRSEFRRARTDYADARLSEEITALEQRLSRRENPAARNRIAVAYAKYGRIDEALDAIDFAIGMDSAYLPAFMNKANILALRGDFALAAEIVSGLLSSPQMETGSQQHFDALILLATLQFSASRYGEAADSYRSAARIDPRRAGDYRYLAGGAGAASADAPTADASRAAAAGKTFSPSWSLSEDSDGE